MSLAKELLDYSIPIVVKKRNIETLASGFFVMKQNKNKSNQLFLVTSYSLIAKANILAFGIILNNDYHWMYIEKTEKDIENFKHDIKNDIAVFNVSNLFDYLTEEQASQINTGYIYKEDIISAKTSEDTGILEDLFVISNTPINDSTTIPIATECSNATIINDKDSKYFLINLPKEDWRLGSPVFIFGDDEIEFAGMVSNSASTPNSLCSVTSAHIIMELLEK
jgi:hypothetical protein